MPADISLKDLMTLLQTFGFSVVMVIWFMVRTEKVIERNTVALDNLTRTEASETEVLRAVALAHGCKVTIDNGSVKLNG
jgi:hypothetical protein